MFRLAEGVRRALGGRSLLGGSPFRIIDLGPGVEVDALLARAEQVTTEPFATLLSHGVVDPVIESFAGSNTAGSNTADTLGGIDVVIPCRNNPSGLATLLDGLVGRGFASVTVVDDGSVPPISANALPAQVRLLRNELPLGAGRARNRGMEAGVAPLVLLLDDDVVVESTGASELAERLSRWFAIDTVGIVAPRIRTLDGAGLVARYEQDRGALDLGPVSGPVAPRTRLPYVPTAAMLVRRSVVEAIDGFRPDLPRGEDVDFVWRAIEAGWTVRYDADIVAEHPARPSLSAWLAQRFRYGRSTSELARDHPDHVAAIEVSPWSVAPWLLVSGGGWLGPIAGVALWAGSTAAFVPSLRGKVDDPVRQARQLAGNGTLHAGPILAETVRRSWAPLVAVAAMRSASARRAWWASWLIGPLLDWRRSERSVTVAPWVALRMAEDAAYCAGVWRGIIDHHSLRCLRLRPHRADDLFLDLTEGR